MNGIYSSIHDVVADYVIAKLEQRLIIESPDPQLTATDVSYGNLQDNPAKKRISVRIHLRDPDQLSDTEPHWADIPASSTPYDEWGAYPEAEIGSSGSGFWARRIVVEINVYLTRTKEDRMDARMIANYVTNSAKDAIDKCGCCEGDTYKDDFGEVLLNLKAMRIVIVEGGGPPRDFNYRAKIYISALTEKS